MHESPLQGNARMGLVRLMFLVDGQSERGRGRRGDRGAPGPGHRKGVTAGSGS